MKTIFNTIANKQLKQCLNGGSVGYWLTSKTFVPTSKINAKVELIPVDVNCPF